VECVERNSIVIAVIVCLSSREFYCFINSNWTECMEMAIVGVNDIIECLMAGLIVNL